MEKKVNEKRLVIKFSLCLVYLIIISILAVCSYKIFETKKDVFKWEDVKDVNDYSYIEISKMSEAFAKIDDEREVHFVIEQEDTGLWHTYLILINSGDYDKYKNIIDYTYQRITDKPDTIKVYGYPVILDDTLKNLAIKNINNFVPAENEVEITSDNFYQYLTNSYLDTTQQRKDSFDFILLSLLLMLFIMVVLFIFTIFNKDRLVDNAYIKVEHINKNTKRLLRFKR